MAKTKKIFFPVSSIEIDQVYLIMDKRKSLKYSDRQLSLLLGYRALYVRDIENPIHTLRYTPKDTNYLLHIFQCQLSEILNAKIHDFYYQINVATVKHKNGTITYDISRELANKTVVPFRKFTTEPDVEDFGLEPDEAIEQFIDKLFESDYFKVGKTALEIFDCCREKFGKDLHPGAVLGIIAKYTGKRKSPRLVKGKNESSRTVYSRE